MPGEMRRRLRRGSACFASKRAQPLRVLAHEARHPAPVPKRAPREEPPVDLGRVPVRHGRGGHVPALPTGLRRSVAELDVLAVEPEALVEATELLQHLAPEQKEGAEHPVRLHRLGWVLVEQVVRALALERARRVAERRPSDERACHGREAAAYVALGALALGFGFVGFAAFVERRWGGDHRLGSALASVVHGLAAVRRPGQAAIAFGWTIASWLVLGIAFWLLSAGFHLGLSPLAGMLVAISVGVSFLIPAAPGGLGVFEAAGLAATAAYGVSTSRALAYVLVLHAVSLIPFLIAGVVVLVLSAPRRRPAQRLSTVRKSV